MRRMIDFYCCECSYEVLDVMAQEDERRCCPKCGVVMTQRWWAARRADAQWDDKTAVLVHVTDDPSVPEDCRVRYVGSHDAKLKDGYRRMYLRSLREVDRFEREHKVAVHAMHYDSNGRALDDGIGESR